MNASRGQRFAAIKIRSKKTWENRRTISKEWRKHSNLEAKNMRIQGKMGNHSNRQMDQKLAGIAIRRRYRRNLRIALPDKLGKGNAKWHWWPGTGRKRTRTGPTMSGIYTDMTLYVSEREEQNNRRREERRDQNNIETDQTANKSCDR